MIIVYHYALSIHITDSDNYRSMVEVYYDGCSKNTVLRNVNRLLSPPCTVAIVTMTNKYLNVIG